MTTAIQCWKTNTMIFNDPETVQKFLSYFSEKIASFEDLNKDFLESKELEKFSIEVKRDKVVFIWNFKDRESYGRFMLLLYNTDFYPLLYKHIGWQLIRAGSV